MYLIQFINHLTNLHLAHFFKQNILLEMDGALGWDIDEASKHVKEIREIGSELYNRIATWAEHLDKVGQGLQSATNSYNAAMASLDSRVLPGIRKLPELGISTDKIIKEEPNLLYSNIREIPQSLRTTSENEHKDAI